MADIEPIPMSEVEHLSSLRVEMFQRTYDLNPAEDLALSVSKIGEHLQSQPSKYAFYASLKDLANSKVDQLVAKLHRVRAINDSKIRVEGCLPDGNKITEDSMRRCLNTLEDVVAAEKAVLRAQADLAVLSSIVRAFEQRRDCLIALSNRQNSGVFHDKNISATVHADINPVQKLREETAGAGSFKAKVKK